jgi:hypothetical protein
MMPFNSSLQSIIITSKLSANPVFPVRSDLLCVCYYIPILDYLKISCLAELLMILGAKRRLDG